MRRFVTAAATMGITLVAAGGLLVGFADSASASTVPPWEQPGSIDANEVGGLTFFDSSGSQVTGGNTASPIAAFVEGTNTLRNLDSSASLFGYLPVTGTAAGGWHGEQLAGPTAYPDASAPTGISQTLPVVEHGSHDLTIADLVSDYPNTDTSSDGYAGLYQLRLFTTGSGSQTTTYDSADIQISGSTWSVVYPAPSLTSTTTTLTTTQTSPQVAGTPVQLNASVSPAVPGTVQFEDGSTDIGSPVTVTGGTASTTDPTLAVGAHTLKAAFTPSAFSAYSGSNGTTPFTISAPPAAGTTTALGVNPYPNAPAFSAVTLTATVTKASDSSVITSGTVKFFDNGTAQLGSTVPVGAGGVATLTYSAFSVGAHSLTAQFIPADPTVYATSTSGAIAFTATTPATQPKAQTVDVDVPAGTLTITTPYDLDNPFDLGTAVLDPNESKFTATKPFGSALNPANGVTVTDTRAGDQPWTASATVTDFADGATPPDVINGQNLTFTGVTASYISGNALQSGVTTTDITNSGIYAPTDGGSDGLKGGPHQFATIARGDGEVNIDGRLTLTAPTSTVAGNYTATLTFTVA